MDYRVRYISKNELRLKCLMKEYIRRYLWQIFGGAPRVI
jgi:hypothetical protein